MEKIKMVDLQRQNKEIEAEISSSIAEIIQACDFINGKKVKQFSSALEEYLGVSHVIPCANGTDALQIALMSLNLQPGDEVITPSFTYIAAIEAIVLLKLTPVFIDIDPGTFCLDPNEVKKAITGRTKVIIAVHLFGQAAPMEELMLIAKESDLFVIEDNAQALGCTYTFKSGEKKKTGTIGTIGTTSFYPSKNLSCFGDGGAIFVNSDELAKKIRMIANHGQERQYHHSLLGCNSRLDSIQAAILLIKIKKLDEYNHRRKLTADFYDQAFKSSKTIILPKRTDYSDHIFHQYTIKLNGINRKLLGESLSKKEIPFMIYYPLGSHKQKFLETYPIKCLKLNNTDDVCETVLSLPMHSELDSEQLNYIVQNIIEFTKEPENTGLLV